jgi:flagellar M-ring protein FliF
LDQFVKALQGFGIGRLAAILGAGAGAAAILIALMLRIGGQPTSLLYANLDLKEAGEITSQLDTAGVKYEVKGDGSTIFVDRDKVASTRLMLSGKGLPTSGSVGYEIFDNAPALGQTDFVQNLNRQRALEGELARTIRSIQGISFVRVHLVMPRRQLFDQDAEQASASILIATGGGRIGAEQVRSIRNLVAAAVPDLKPDRVSITDQQGELLAAEGDGAVDGMGGGERNQVEERIRRTVKDIVEGVVGPGHARVQVSADVDMSSHTTQSEKYDPDGQVVRSTATTDEKSAETKANGASGAASASQNVPGAAPTGSSGDSTNTGHQEETTNYEISKTTTTDVQAPGQVKRLSVAVAVDGTTGPPVHGKPGPYTPRSAEEMKQIETLVRSAMGFDQARGDQVSVVNVQFDRALDGDGASVASPFSFDKNDVMRGAEMLVLAAVAGMIVFFVLKPMLKVSAGGGGSPFVTALATSPVGGGGGGALGFDGGAGGQLALPGPDNDVRLDIARIEGQVKASSVKRVSEFVERHPDESVAILRSWLHDA